MLDEPGSPDLLIKRWFARFPSGCLFAARVTSSNTLNYTASFAGDLSNPDAQNDINALLDTAAALHKAAILIFPDITTEKQLIAMIQRLGAMHRWTLDIPETTADDSLSVALSWETQSGHLARAQGLAPLLTMPVMRRAPYVALALWPGAHENPHFTGRGKRVSFADMDTKLDARLHEQYWNESRANTAAWLAGRRVAESHHSISFSFSTDLANDLQSEEQ